MAMLNNQMVYCFITYLIRCMAMCHLYHRKMGFTLTFPPERTKAPTWPALPALALRPEESPGPNCWWMLWDASDFPRENERIFQGKPLVMTNSLLIIEHGHENLVDWASYKMVDLSSSLCKGLPGRLSQISTTGFPAGFPYEHAPTNLRPGFCWLGSCYMMCWAKHPLGTWMTCCSLRGQMMLIGIHRVNSWSYISGWWYTYPSEKWWSSSVGMMTFPNWMESHSKFHGSSHHQPVYIYIYIYNP